ncbi:MAG TPA: VanZ family protein [Epsilonproteobacteria bacterium]|nr:VanZ family protein [Campylobacterota bacterium]
MPVQYSKNIRFIFWLALVVSYISAIVPQDVAPTLGDLSDKTLHFLAFSILTFLLFLSYRLALRKGIFFLLFYACFIEFSQYFTPNRCAEWLDIVADSIGIAIGLILYAGYKKLEEICENS